MNNEIEKIRITLRHKMQVDAFSEKKFLLQGSSGFGRCAISPVTKFEFESAPGLTVWFSLNRLLDNRITLFIIHRQ